MQSENNSSSENLYYSPTNTDSDNEYPIIDCNCNKPDKSCLIFCFNMNTNQFECIDCKIFRELILKNY